jgi:hypothetical protein
MALDQIRKLHSTTECSGGVDSTPVQPFGRPREREEREEEADAPGGEETHGLLCVILSPGALLYTGGRVCTSPLFEGYQGWQQLGKVGPGQPTRTNPKTLT